MAGDWIKVRPSLVSSPKVKGIVKYLKTNPEVSNVLAPGFDGNINDIVTRNVMCNVTVTLLVAVWGAANEHTNSGVFKNFDYSDIDDIAGVPGFAKAMESVGWLIHDPEAHTITLPNFSEYNTCDSERDKKNNRERQRRYREKLKERNANNNVTDNVTCNDRIEEKREEESNKEKEKKETQPDGSSPSIPKQDELDFLIDSWNQLPTGIAPRVESRRSDPIVKGWKKVQRTSELKQAFADIPHLMSKIKSGKFLHGEGWFRFPWLFAKGKTGEWNVLKILDGDRYAGNETAGRAKSTARVTDEASRDALKFLE